MWGIVAVAVSGGCDSMALLWLARQAFTNLTSLTVDLRWVHQRLHLARV